MHLDSAFVLSWGVHVRRRILLIAILTAVFVCMSVTAYAVGFAAEASQQCAAAGGTGCQSANPIVYVASERWVTASANLVSRWSAEPWSMIDSKIIYYTTYGFLVVGGAVWGITASLTRFVGSLQGRSK